MPDTYVKLPDGSYAQFPEGMSDAQITAALKSSSDTQGTGAAQAPATWADKTGLNAPTPPGTPIRAGLKGAAAGAVDLVQGATAGAASTVLGAAKVGNAVNRAMGGQDIQIKPGAEAALTNVPDTLSGHIGQGLEMGAELALPMSAAKEAIPSTVRAGQKFQEVMGAAKHVPVDINAAGDVALRIQQLAERGASMPLAVRKFLGRITDPGKAAMTYDESRDFASNISRLSANEMGRLTPVVAREVANLRVALNLANAKAAAAVGQGATYASAMNEYARAMQARGMVESALQGARRAVPFATGAGAAYWLTQKMKDLWPGD